MPLLCTNMYDWTTDRYLVRFKNIKPIKSGYALCVHISNQSSHIFHLKSERWLDLI